MAAALADEPDIELLSLWADTMQVHALFHMRASSDFLLCSVPVEAEIYPALSPCRPAAAWFERMIHDLWGHVAQAPDDAGTDQRPWLDHGRWSVPAPLSPRPIATPGMPEPMEFLPVEADDYHQIAVGPVHAGIIEPGHFRFSAQGETVVRLEIRLGYLHKGTLGLMRGKSPRAAARRRPAVRRFHRRTRHRLRPCRRSRRRHRRPGPGRGVACGHGRDRTRRQPPRRLRRDRQ